MPVVDTGPERSPLRGVRSSMRFFAKFTASVERKNSIDRSYTERRILLELLDHPDRVDASIGRSLGMESAQLSRALKQLKSECLVLDRKNPHHARQRIRFLSLDGIEIARQISDKHDDDIRDQFEKIPASDKDILTQTLGVSDFELESSKGDVSINIVTVGLQDYEWICNRICHTQKQTKWNNKFFGAASATIYFFANEPTFRDEATGWIAYFRGRPIGGILMHSDEERMHGTIGFLYVDPDKRLTGIASMLLKKCLNVAEEMTMTTVDIKVPDGWNTEHALLTKHEFICEKGKEPDFEFGQKLFWNSYVHNLPLFEEPRTKL